jgi:hypothetical protein
LRRYHHEVTVRVALLALAVLVSSTQVACRRFGYAERWPAADSDASTPDGALDGGGEYRRDAGMGTPGGKGGIGADNDASEPQMDAGAGTDGGTDGGSTPSDAGGDAGMPPADAGSGLPDAGGDAAVLPPDAAIGPLIHRYSFDNLGSTACGNGIATAECAEDSIGGAHGQIFNATRIDGAVRFVNADWPDSSPDYDATPEYVALPPYMISTLVQTTVEVWFKWTGEMRGLTPAGQSFQTFYHPRVFDLGQNDVDSNGDGHGDDKPRTFLYVTPSYGSGRIPRASFTLNGLDTNTFIYSTWSGAISVNTEHFAALRFDGTRLALFVEGQPAASTGAIAGRLLADLNDDKNWLGRSPVSVDSPFIGEISEFRIYDVARSNTEIMDDYVRGADTP